MENPVLNQLQELEETEHCVVGIIFHRDDEVIAKRIQQHVNCIWKNVNVKLFQPPGGFLEFEPFHDFTEECNSIWWVGTESSLNDKMAKHHLESLLHKSIVETKTHFTFLAPKENLRINVPSVLKSYNTLSEDEKFEERVESTLNYVMEKQKRGTIKRNSPDVQVELEKQTINIFGNVGFLQIGGQAHFPESQSNSDVLKK